MGCIARIGCLIVLVCLAIGAWITRDRWIHRISGRPAVTSTAPGWEPLTPTAGAAGKRKLDDLAKPSGPVFANLSASEVASYVFQTVARTIPASADSAEAAVIGDALYVRAVVPVRDIAGTGVLGPLAGLLNDRERLQLGGAFRVIRPGLSNALWAMSRLAPGFMFKQLAKVAKRGRKTAPLAV